MVFIYLMDVSPLKDEKIYAAVRGRLSEERKKKADSYRFLSDRCLSLGAGELLRQVCERHGIPYTDSSFSIGSNGKPDFSGGSGHFSLSHSGKYAVCAFCDCVIGCDIEKISSFDIKIAEKCFVKEELEEFSSIKDKKEKQEFFFRLWTMKESFVKCTGQGMTLDFDRFAIENINGRRVICYPQDSFFYALGEKALDGYRISWCVRLAHGCADEIYKSPAQIFELFPV